MDKENVLLYYFVVAISSDGRLTTATYMAEYNQNRFELEIIAKENQPPEREARAKVYVSFYLLVLNNSTNTIPIKYL